MITTSTPSYPYWIVSGEWNQPCRDGIPMRGNHYKFFLIGNVFEYLSSCPTHTPHLLFFLTWFNLKFVVAGLISQCMKEFTLNKHFPQKNRKEKRKITSWPHIHRNIVMIWKQPPTPSPTVILNFRRWNVGLWVFGLNPCPCVYSCHFLALFFVKYNQLNDAIKETLGNIEH